MTHSGHFVGGGARGGVVVVGLIATSGGTFLLLLPLLLLLLLAFFLLTRHLTLLSQSIDQLKSPTMWKGAVPAGLLPLGLAAAAASSASATLLYVSSYAGTVTTLSLSLPPGDPTTAAAGAGATLDAIYNSTGCGPSPSWLTLDYSKNLLFCLDEGLTGPNGGMTSFVTNDDGTLVTANTLDIIQGPVSIAEFGVGGQGLAIAH